MKISKKVWLSALAGIILASGVSAQSITLTNIFGGDADNLYSDDFIKFINMLKIYNKDVDIMLEAKAKDDALSRLVRELKYKTNYEFINETSFII